MSEPSRILAPRRAEAPVAVVVLRRCGGRPCPAGRCDHHGTLGRTTTETGPATAPPAVYRTLGSPGQVLDAGARSYLEPRFGYDFSRVRVHADADAAMSAAQVGARAYTVGSHIVFSSGAYAPGTDEGRRLIAHELAHVLQQRHGSPGLTGAGLAVGAADDPTERHAEEAADASARALDAEAYAVGSHIVFRPAVAAATPIVRRLPNATPAAPASPSGANTAWGTTVSQSVFDAFSPEQQAVFRRVYAALQRAGLWADVVNVKGVNVEYNQIDATVSPDLESRLSVDLHFCADRGLTNVHHRGKSSFREVVRPGTPGLHISIQPGGGDAMLHLDSVSPVIGRGESGACAMGAGVGLLHQLRDVFHIRGELPHAPEPGETPF